MHNRTAKANLTADQQLAPTADGIRLAAERLIDVVTHTPYLRNHNLSRQHEANIWLKREDMQVVRSFKVRGAYNKIISLNESERARGIVCASAGNHSQGVAYACALLKIKGTIFMPAPTPAQKIAQTKRYGQGYVDLVLAGDSFDDAYQRAIKYQKQHGAVLVHPFDDRAVIEGQGTVGLEITESAEHPIDYLLVPIGGGGLAAGVCTWFKQHSPNTKIIGVEPAGAAAMHASIAAGSKITLEKIDNFVDGAAVKCVGDITYAICKEHLDRIICVPEGKICSSILKLYNEEAIVIEPAGALSIAALDYMHDEIRDKNVACIISGGNNDITRTGEIKERSLLFEGRKHYFVVNFPQRAGALREFLHKVLGPEDDIVHFEYSKKNYREQGPAVIGIEVPDPCELDALIARMQAHHVQFEYLNNNPALFQYLI